MSLIEDAVKRLAQNRQQGVKAPAPPGEIGEVACSPRPDPMPDADKPGAGSNARAAPTGSTAGDFSGFISSFTSGFNSGSPPGSALFGGAIELPEAKLKAAGLLTPASRANATGHEFRIIKGPILEKAFGGKDRQIPNGRRVVVTSSVADEGKTFCAINLAISIAATGTRSVLLIDADVAKPSIAERLGLEASAGLIDLLTRREHDPRKLILNTDLPGLAVLPAGSAEAHSGEYLASGEMTALLDRLSADLPQFLIIIDTPPLLAVTETRALVQQAGHTLLVVAAGATTRTVLNAALASIAGSSDISLVLNKLPESRSEFAAYYEY
jgi:protein-tyrosine kinase